MKKIFVMLTALMICALCMGLPAGASAAVLPDIAMVEANGVIREYTNLYDAYVGMQEADNSTLTLLRDVECNASSSARINSGKTHTLNLAEYTLNETGNNSKIWVTNDTTLTMTGGENGRLIEKHNNGIAVSSGTLIVAGGTIQTTAENTYAVSVSGTLELQGGKLSGVAGDIQYNGGTVKVSRADALPEEGYTLTINASSGAQVGTDIILPENCYAFDGSNTVVTQLENGSTYTLKQCDHEGTEARYKDDEKHEIVCIACGHVQGTADHELKYENLKNGTHREACTQCSYESETDEFHDFRGDKHECICGAKRYVITFDWNDEGDSSYSWQEEVEVGNGLGWDVSTYIPSRDGYQFGGWYTTRDAQPGTKWDLEAALTCVSGHAAVYAKWIKAYPLYVSGEQVTDENLSGSGWSYNPSSNTLTLSGADIEGKINEYRNAHHGAGICYYGYGETLNLVVNGTNTVKAKFAEEYQCRAIDISSAHLNITGSGTLNVQAIAYVPVTEYAPQEGCYAIHLMGGIPDGGSGTLTIDGVTINAKAENTNRIIYSGAIFTEGDIAIRDAKVSAYINHDGKNEGSGTADMTGAIYSESGDISIEGSEVEAYAGKGPSISAGIGTGDGDITIKDSTVTGVGGTSYVYGQEGNDPSYGIGANGRLSISDSIVTARGGKAGSNSYGLAATAKGISISASEIDAAGGEAYAESFGIGTDGELTITDCEVTAAGGKAGVVSYGVGATNGISVTDAQITTKAGDAPLAYGMGSEGNITFADATADNPQNILDATGGTVAVGVRGGKIDWPESGYVFTVTGETGTEKKDSIPDGATPPYVYIRMEPGMLDKVITFDANGGTGTMAQQTISGANQKLNANAFTREGHEFTGWNTQADGKGTAYADQDTAPQSDLTLYAQWKILEYTITFIDDNGTPDDETDDTVLYEITQDYGTEVTEPENPEKTGYTFVSWDQDIPATMPAEDMTITAVWETDSYTITFSGEGGVWKAEEEGQEDKTVVQITGAYGAVLTPPADPTREGYTFAGWNGDIPKTIPAQNITFGAVWTPVEYKITYDLAGGTFSEGVSAREIYTIETATFKLLKPHRDGYQFAGWIGTDLEAAMIDVSIEMGSMGDRHYTATWVPETTEVIPFGSVYRVIHYKQQPDGTYAEAETEFPLYGEIDQEVTAEPKDYAGYVLNEAISEMSKMLEQAYPDEAGEPVVTELTLYYDLETYTITYDLAGGALETGKTNPETYTVETETFTLNNPVLAGYTFAGWTGTDLETATVDVTIEKGSTGDRSYTAAWQKLSFNAIFDANGGSWAEGVTTIAVPTEFGAAIVVPLENPVREGYVFDG